MSANAALFRKLALGLPGAVESAHMGHPDFRLHNRIFATLSGGDKGLRRIDADAWAAKRLRRRASRDI